MYFSLGPKISKTIADIIAWKCLARAQEKYEIIVCVWSIDQRSIFGIEKEHGLIIAASQKIKGMESQVLFVKIQRGIYHWNQETKASPISCCFTTRLTIWQLKNREDQRWFNLASWEENYYHKRTNQSRMLQSMLRKLKISIYFPQCCSSRRHHRVGISYMAKWQVLTLVCRSIYQTFLFSIRNDLESDVDRSRWSVPKVVHHTPYLLRTQWRIRKGILTLTSTCIQVEVFVLEQVDRPLA